jgi:hypothetical protein
MGLQYPKLDIFTQSLIDTNDGVALNDLVDGMDLSEDWGNEHLDLSGLSDAGWMQWKNDSIVAAEKYNRLDEEMDDDYIAKGFSRKETWERVTRSKQHRCGFKHPTEIFATKFRAHNSPDPRTEDRHVA